MSTSVESTSGWDSLVMDASCLIYAIGFLGLVKCKSDHSYYSHHAPLTASQRLQAHKENALTERAKRKTLS